MWEQVDVPRSRGAAVEMDRRPCMGKDPVAATASERVDVQSAAQRQAAARHKSSLVSAQQQSQETTK
jgi:hypothetical protein